MTYNPDGKDLHELADEAYDAFDDAMTDEPRCFAGQVITNAWTCVLIKGQGKVPYDPAVHKDQRKSTAIEFTIAPLDPTRRLITRVGKTAMLNWTVEFRQVVRPSIEALAEDIATIKGLIVGEFNLLKKMSGLWVIGEFVPRPDDECWSTLKFLAVYPNRDACAEAYTEYAVASAEAKKEKASEGNDVARQAAAAFLPLLWKQASEHLDEMAQLIADNSIVAAHFTIDSPEVLEVVNG